MLPMSIQCQNCGEYVSKGKKFNGRKEEAVGESYLGIKVWRFYLRCTSCLAELTFKTDPKRNDYTVERGATRNFEPWKQITAEAALEAAKKAREEVGDSMKVLENRTEQSKREMELQDAIEEVREMNARAAALTTDQIIDIHSGSAMRLEESQIEQMAQEAFAKKRNGGGMATNGSSAAAAASSSAASVAGISTAASAAAPPFSSLPVLKRLPDAVDLAEVDFKPEVASQLDQIEVPDSPTDAGVIPEGDESKSATISSSASSVSAAAANGSPPPAAAPSSSSASPALSAPSPLAGIVLIKKRKPEEDAIKEAKKKAKKEKKEKEKAVSAAAPAPAPSVASASSGGLGGLLGAYDDDSE